MIRASNKNSKTGNNSINSWKEFVSGYSLYVLKEVKKWCTPYCERDKSQYSCFFINFDKPAASQRQSCDDGMDMYIFAFQELKKRIHKFIHKKELPAYVIKNMEFIKKDYFIHKYGKINIPVCLNNIDETSEKVYKLLRMNKDTNEIAVKLGMSEDQVSSYILKIRNILWRNNSEWRHLDGWLTEYYPPTSLNICNEEDEYSIELPVYDIPAEQREGIEILKMAVAAIPYNLQRLLEIKYVKNYSAERILQSAKIFKFLDINNTDQVYTQIEKAFCLISKELEKLCKTRPFTKDIKEIMPDLVKIHNLFSDDDLTGKSGHKEGI